MQIYQFTSILYTKWQTHALRKWSSKMEYDALFFWGVGVPYTFIVFNNLIHN